MRKEKVWTDPEVARAYEQRWSGAHGPRHALGRRKQRHDELLVLGLLRRAGVTAPARVLDLPCGTGRMTPALAGAGLAVVGVDLSRPMLRAGHEAARDDPALGRLQASAFRLPFDDGAFAAALCLRFLFHLDDGEERARVLRELRRVTRGPLILQVRYRDTGKHAGRWLRRRFGGAPAYRPAQGRVELERELHGVGLELGILQPVSWLFSDKALLVVH